MFSQEILISDGGTVNTCSGTFYDSGGPTGVYSANEDYTITICPENDAQVIELDFDSFTTQPRYNKFDGFEYSDVIKESNKKIDVIQKRLTIQSKSLDEIAKLAEDKEKLLKSIPAIQPVNNDDLIFLFYIEINIQ